MKKLISILTVIGFVLAFGTAYAGADKIAAGSGYDSLFNALDPSTVPGHVNLESGIITQESAVLAPRGSAAGGIGMERDSFLNYIDPSSVPGYVNPETGIVTPEPTSFTPRGSAAGGIGMDTDTFPENVAGV